MTNRELAAKRAQLRLKCERVATLSPMLAMGEFKVAALMMSEITDELTRRELSRETPIRGNLGKPLVPETADHE